MKKLTTTLALAAAATLAACAGVQETRVSGSAESIYVAGTVPTGGTVRPGYARVGSPMVSNTPVDGRASQTLTMNMKDGAKQTLFVQGGQLKAGEEVEIQSDNRIRRFQQQ